MAFNTTGVMTLPASSHFFPIMCVTVPPSLPSGPTITLLIAGHLECRSVPGDAPCGWQAIKWQINTRGRGIFVLPRPALTPSSCVFLSRGGQQGCHALRGGAAYGKGHLCSGEACTLPMRPFCRRVNINNLL